MMRNLKFVLTLLLIPVLAACAAPARMEMMTAGSLAPDAVTILATSPLKGQVAVASVTGGEKTNPLWVSQVGNPEFKSALAESLRKFGLLNEGGDARYVLDAGLMSLAQPMVGIDMTVTSTVHYRLTDGRTKSPVFDQHVVMPYTATFGDAFVGVERLKLANEGAIRLNVEMAIADMLRKVTVPSVAATGTPTS